MASTETSTQDGDPYADRRAYPRAAVALPAFVQARGERQSVQSLDLSPGGAKLSCTAVFPAETILLLDCGTFSRTAVVRWENGGTLGLCFESELDSREVAALVERSSALADRMKPGK